MPENGASKNWWKKIIVVFLFFGRQLVYTINYNISMVNSKFDLVKMEPIRVMELSLVNQSLLERLSMAISADRYDYLLKMVDEATVRLICVTTAVNLTNSEFGLILVNQRLADLDSIPLDLGKSDRIRLIWKPGFYIKRLLAGKQNEMMKIVVGSSQLSSSFREKTKL